MEHPTFFFVLLVLLIIANAVLEGMLFWKVWNMTNDVKNINFNVESNITHYPTSRDSALAQYACGHKQAAIDTLCYETCCAILIAMGDFETEKTFNATRDSILQKSEYRFKAINTEIPSELRNITFEQIIQLQ